jgi:hypothetical protein
MIRMACGGQVPRSSERISARGLAARSGVSATRSRCLRRSPTPGTSGAMTSASPAENAATSAEPDVARYQTTSSRPWTHSVASVVLP